MSVARSRFGVVTSPHALASEAGLAVLTRGGNAIEAAIAVGSTLCVVQPHMNGLGGDAFWLICDETGGLHALDGAGPAGSAVSIDCYPTPAIPVRGAAAANTVAGLVSTWGKAFEHSASHWRGSMQWDALLESARQHALRGFSPGAQLKSDFAAKRADLAGCARFVQIFGEAAGELFRQPELAASLAILQRDGASAFYSGQLAQRIIEGLQAEGSRLLAEDFAHFESRSVMPLATPFYRGMAWNLPPPTQGLASLIILALADRLGIEKRDPRGADYIHLLVEATKLAFAIRERHVADPDFVPAPLTQLLSDSHLDGLARQVDAHRARPVGSPDARGDTVWFGVIDERGRAVSVIQSLYFEFGSGIVAGNTGIVWQNRGSSFSLDPRNANALLPRKRPRHTLNPAMYLEQGKPRLVYGTMGGDGQPQTQAAVATRALLFGFPLDEAISAPRWLLGKTWGAESASLKLESRFEASVFEDLEARGHTVERVDAFSQLMGHAGALRVLPSGDMEAASDPRSEGVALGVR
jgi:gamma-glutamyltranspeptidase/glutathione hydrolase